jgi:hypothetical protein
MLRVCLMCIYLFISFYWPKLMDPCVDSRCTHPIDVLFWSLPICLLGFFSKYECWVIDLIMFLYHFFFGLSHAFSYNKVSYHYKILKTIHMTSFSDDKIFIGDGLGRMTIGSHSNLSYHVSSHNMLKWIILIQNLLYNYL